MQRMRAQETRSGKHHDTEVKKLQSAMETEQNFVQHWPEHPHLFYAEREAVERHCDILFKKLVSKTV